jgi:tripartite-type tricarboxylate transporter receptor subunit TctC
MRRSLGFFAVLFGLVLAHVPAGAQDFPQRTMTLVCPFPAGGGSDLLARMLATELADKLKQTVVVENRTGGGTLIAAQAVAKSPPDGHTLLLAPVTTLAIAPSIYKSVPFDSVKDFAPVGLVGSAQFALVANPSLGAKTLTELIAFIRSKPGELSYGTSGAATPHHLLMEMFLKMIGGKAQHVPYRGSQPALTDVVTSELQIMMVDLGIAIPLIQQGKVRAYGVVSPMRVKSVPEIPTLEEAGLPNFGGRGWFSIVARAGTPRPVVDRLNSILMSYLKRPDVDDRLQGVAIDVLTSTPDELATFIPAEITKWAQVVQDAGITPE